MRDPFPAPPAGITKATETLASALALRTLPLHAHEIIVAFTLYHFINNVISPRLSTHFFPRTYPSLSPKTKINWNVHMVSMVQSLFINTVALWVIFADGERKSMSWRERVWGYSGATGMVQAFSAGYFVWDLLASAMDVDVHGWGALVHAASAVVVSGLGFVSFSPSSLFLVDLGGKEGKGGGVGGPGADVKVYKKRPFLNYYGLNFVLYELSTPFLDIHWFLDKLGLTGSRAQLINGIALIASFGASRLVWGTYQSVNMYRDVWRALNTHEELPVPPWLALAYLLANTLLSGLNFYWFGRMIVTVRKRFDKPKVDADKKES